MRLYNTNTFTLKCQTFYDGPNGRLGWKHPVFTPSKMFLNFSSVFNRRNLSFMSLVYETLNRKTNLSVYYCPIMCMVKWSLFSSRYSDRRLSTIISVGLVIDRLVINLFLYPHFSAVLSLLNVKLRILCCEIAYTRSESFFFC